MKILRYKTVRSTNDICKKLSKRTHEDFWVIADSQTNGYGKYGRPFVSPNGNIYMSYHFNCKMNNFNIDLLSIITGITILYSIKQILGIEIQLKWINDLMYRDKKVGGILIEADYNKNVTIGIGINLFKPKETDSHIGGLCDVLNRDAKNSIIENIISNVPINIFNRQINWITEYKKFNYLKNKYVQLRLGTKEISGKVVGFGPKGEIQLIHNNRKFSFNSGEVIKTYFD